MTADALAAGAADEAADLVAEARQLELLQLGLPCLRVLFLGDREQTLEGAPVFRDTRDRVCELEHFLRVCRTMDSRSAPNGQHSFAAFVAET